MNFYQGKTVDHLVNGCGTTGFLRDGEAGDSGRPVCKRCVKVAESREARIVKAESTLLCGTCGGDDHVAEGCAEAVSPYAASVTRYVVREGGYAPIEAAAMVRRYAETVDRGDRFGSNVDYVAWEIMDLDARSAKGEAPPQRISGTVTLTPLGGSVFHAVCRACGWSKEIGNAGTALRQAQGHVHKVADESITVAEATVSAWVAKGSKRKINRGRRHEQKKGK